MMRSLPLMPVRVEIPRGKGGLHDARGWCSQSNTRWKRSGDAALERPGTEPVGILRGGKGGSGVALVSGRSRPLAGYFVVTGRL